MILPDVNVLVHAHNADSLVHEPARRWWDACLSGAEGVGLAWAVILGVVRITTNRKVVARPLAVRDVMRRLEVRLALPQVHIVQPADSRFLRLRAELERLGAAGNLTTDAHLAVLAMERGYYVLYSTDADFARFPGLRWLTHANEPSLAVTQRPPAQLLPGVGAKGTGRPGDAVPTARNSCRPAPGFLLEASHTHPEGGALEMSHSSHTRRPARKSASACSAKPSSLPAAASRSILSSKRAASKASNHARNCAS